MPLRSMNLRAPRGVADQLLLLPLDPDAEAHGPFERLCRALGVVRAPGWVDAFGAALHARMSNRRGDPVRTLSLFSGAGGLDIGFHDAGFDVIEMVEIEARFVESLRANCGPSAYLGTASPVCADIRDYAAQVAAGARASLGRIDFIIGGPPCQTFSAAGRRAAGVQGTDDARGALFREYVKLLHLLRPKGFLFENVYGITGAQGGRAWAEIQREFKAAGYEIAFRVLDAADYGVPQHRERLFIVGTRDGCYRFPLPTHGEDSPGALPRYSAGDAVRGAIVSDLEARARINGRYGQLLLEIPPGLNYSFFTERMGHPKPVFAWRSKFSDFLYKADPAAPIRTLKAQGGQYTGPFHWDSRPFSLDELKRLQTFPARYDVQGRRQVAIQQLGNSVPPQLARILAMSILQQVFGVQLPVSLPTMPPEHHLGFRTRKRLRTDAYRMTAASALVTSAPTRSSRKSVRARRYGANLTRAFDWQPTPGDGDWVVQFHPRRERWLVELSEPGLADRPIAYEIVILPSPEAGSWAVPTGRVVLRSRSQLTTSLTCLWKALELELARANIKADLVQLCGYYQYSPAFKARMRLVKARGTPWTFIKLVTEGVGVRSMLGDTELARLWGCRPESVLRHAEMLRTFGFEVRNTNTNPQIPERSFLVPYPFPTFTSLSVQLRKSLS